MSLPIGTLVNVLTVLVGAAIGAVAGSRFPERFRTTLMATLGLITAALGIREVMATGEFPLVIAAVLVGVLLGESLRIEQGLERFGRFLQSRVSSEDVSGGGQRKFSEGFVLASLVFCVGPLTIVGSIRDGLGDHEMLLVKAALDGFASIAFAAVYGWGVALAAVTVAVIQGGIAAAGGALDGVLTDPMIDALATAGGILLLGIALRLLELKQVRVANMLPAIALAPLFVAIWS
ncbi:MAG TPA: DUF554 domain-containing protein [Acidimicrobiia bacterium]|nr:DUF554 domain-containing protein [Acidimicrobiia bacterium]